MLGWHLFKRRTTKVTPTHTYNNKHFYWAFFISKSKKRGSLKRRSQRLQFAHHIKWILVVPCEHFALKRFEILSVNIVLMFSPWGPSSFHLQSPMARENWREHQELVAGHVHLVDLKEASIFITTNHSYSKRDSIKQTLEKVSWASK